MIFYEEWSRPDEFFSSDACLTGCGGSFKGNLFHTVFPEFILDAKLHINWLELLSIIVCLKMWARYIRGKIIRIMCDNKTSVTVINTGKSRNSFLQNCLKELCFIAAIHEFEVCAVHLAGSENRIADFLSRCHLSNEFKDKFYTSVDCNLHDYIAEDLFFKFTHDWWHL